MAGRELETLLKEERGQFLEFASAYDPKKRGTQTKRPRDLAREIARLLGGMANADGGVLLVGVEPDKSLTGLPYSEDEIRELSEVPRRLLNPPLDPLYERIDLGNLLLLRFEVTPGLEVRRVASGRTFYRVASENPAVPPEQIRRLKEARLSYSFERQRIDRATWDDLDPVSLESFNERVGAPTHPRATLARPYHLVGGSADRPEISMAALLLLAKEPSQWHPRCGIDFVKYEGTERGYGESLNVVRRVRIEQPLWVLIDEAVGRIKEHIRERMVLHDLFFKEHLEYPSFAWQEALVNAVAHRDYSLSGAGIEVWMFDDRLEVRSPGSLPAPVTLNHLKRQERVHFSRNPLLVRALSDLGYMREIGEGVPRMFQQMEQNALHPPDFGEEGFFFTVTLRNTPIYDDETLKWLDRFDRSRLGPRQQRLLVYALSHGKALSTADYQRIADVDRDTAYRDIRGLVKMGILAPVRPKSRSYRVVEPF